jgi:hypothetical protein
MTHDTDTVHVRYMVDGVPAAVRFYTGNPIELFQPARR